MNPARKTQARARPWDQGAEGGAAASFGTWLRRQRELREITLREIVDASKISLRYLEALEGDRFDVLPAPVFARGFLREYAKYVGLNADEVVNHYLYALQSTQPEQLDSGRVATQRSSASTLTYVLLGCAALVALVALISFSAFWSERQREAPPRPPIAAPVTQPLANPAPPPVELPAAVTPPDSAAALAALESESLAPLRVELDFAGECWYEVRVDGSRPTSEVRIQGETLRLDAQQKVVLTLGNAGVVRMVVNGLPYELAATPGQVVRDLLIDLAVAESLRSTPSTAPPPPVAVASPPAPSAAP